MLTDEWIKRTAQKQFEEVDPDKFISCMEELSAFANAIESAACADRDARIAELEQRNRDLHEDVKRFRNHALNEKDARMALEQELAEARKDAERYLKLVRLFGVTKLPCLLESVVGDYVADGKQAIDSAIDNAMKGQQWT